MKKLIIQIPCWNEEEVLHTTLALLPRNLAGIDRVEWLVIDDGSTDRTAEIAAAAGVDHVVRLPRHRGLAAAYCAGIDTCLRLGADIIVNTDADNQYRAADIPELIAPLLSGKAEIVIGARPVRSSQEFSRIKKFLETAGSWAIRRLSDSDIVDAASGFRAMTREAATRLQIFSGYTYTLETLIQGGLSRMAIQSVPVRTNPVTRPSRLVRSVPQYLGRQLVTVLRSFMTYRPLAFFGFPAASLLLAGAAIWGRFFYYYFTEGGHGHVQSLVLGSFLLTAGAVLSVIGLVADLISVNRQLLEKISWRLYELSSTSDSGTGKTLPFLRRKTNRENHREG